MPLADHALWWHLYPLGAVDAPIRADDPRTPQRTLADLGPWLDHAVALGCDGLLLGPIFASATHGYDTLDHFRLDPRLGEEADFDSFLTQARERGLTVILDGVFNHVGATHPLVAGALAGEHGMVRLEDVPGGAPGERRAHGWEGHGDLAELDHDDPAVADLVVEVMTHWLRRGIGGWRLDVAYAVPTRFWARVADRVRAEFPDAFLLGEVIHGDYRGIARDGHLDSVTQYELWKGIWSSLKDTNMWELAHALDRHAELTADSGESRAFLPNTFVGNHDVERIASTVGDGGAALAAVLLMTLPGLPSIYYGDEHAFRGVKGEGFAADDAVRPALPAGPGELSPAGAWLETLHRELVVLRRRHPWIQRGALRVLDKANEWIEYEVSARGSGAREHGEHTLHVRVEAAPRPRAHARVDGADVFRWEG